MVKWISDMPIDEDGRPYLVVENRRLHYGYTTGTCAAAASKMATIALLCNNTPDFVEIVTPNGAVLELSIEDIIRKDDCVSCAVKKDGGDDIDATDGLLIYSEVSLRNDGKIVIYGGEGVGVVTKKGLDQPVGSSAINNVPRSMIKEALEDVCESLGYAGGLNVKIFVPNGVETSKRTFNSRLGIEGGISILGTTGIVEPMSEKALISAVRTEMKMRVANGNEYLLVVPGNYGRSYAQNMDGLNEEIAIKCSNFIGATIDYAVELECKGLLLVGNLGKIVKLAGGVMNTHSKWADCRMEIIASNSLIGGADKDTAMRVLSCISTDDALEVLERSGYLESTISSLIKKVQFHLNHRTRGNMPIGVVVFSSKYGKLGESDNVPELIRKLKEQKQ
jgi:cobalamin biosynthesis protein CbiD